METPLVDYVRSEVEVFMSRRKNRDRRWRSGINFERILSERSSIHVKNNELAATRRRGESGRGSLDRGEKEHKHVDGGKKGNEFERIESFFY
jgi:hypothetical protein